MAFRPPKEEDVKSVLTFGWLSGARTYIAGVGMMLYAIGGWLSGQHDPNAAVKLFLEGLAIVGLRGALAK